MKRGKSEEKNVLHSIEESKNDSSSIFIGGNYEFIKINKFITQLY